MMRKGIRFFTLDGVGDTQEVRFKLYQLVREGVVDDPSGNGTFMDYEAFSEKLFEKYYWRWRDSQFIAAVGTDWIGLTNLQLRAEDKGQFGVTVVKRAYRRQGIAKVLKLLALRHAHDQGVRFIGTRNDRGNIPIIRLNRALSFREV